MVMKKFSLIAVVLIAAMLLCACGSGDGEVQTTGTTGGQVSEGPVGYTFTYDGVQMGVDMDATEVLEELGEPKSRVVSASCAFDGHDILYDYRSFRLTTNAGGFIYEKEGMELRFLLKDGKVTSIQYLLKAAA